MHHVVVPSLVVRYSKKFGLGCGQGTSISMSAVWINTNFSNAHAVVQNLEQQAIASAGSSFSSTLLFLHSTGYGL